ncbi:hypothetical protein AAF712_012219 [Marasmius tenuissimus]|uniref:C2H2-type domain-containing protein n=1 Tax=Marasmius tenuissimus TaxID=585030 RepID=A0ABR2ZI54_9AGAR
MSTLDSEPNLEELQLCPDSTELYTHPVLGGYNVAINSRLKLFICLTCKNAQTTTSIMNHFDSNNHGGVLLKSRDRAVFKKLGQTVGILSAYPSLQSKDSVPQFEGLEAPKASKGCIYCSMTCGHRRMGIHMRDKHPEQKQTNSIDCFSQVLNTGGLRYLIRVVPKASADVDTGLPSTGQPSLDAFLEEFLSNRSQSAIPKRDIPNSRLISPFLKQFNWHLHIQPYNAQALVELVTYPSTNDDLRWVKDLVYKYFNTAIKLLDTTVTHELVLMKLNSDDPTKDGINNTPLHEFHQGEVVSNKYIDVVVRLIVALLRPGGDYRFPSFPELNTALTNLNQKKRVLDLHHVFLLLWAREWACFDDLAKIADPTICFLVLAHLKPDSTFLGPKVVTRYVAQLCWSIHMVILMEIHWGVIKKRYQNQMQAMDALQPMVVDKQGHSAP